MAPCKMNLMTAPQRVTGYNIYDDDSDVPTQHSLHEENRVFAYKSKFKDCRTNFLTDVYVKTEIVINLQRPKVDGTGRIWLAGIGRLVMSFLFNMPFYVVHFALDVLLPW